MRSGAAPVLTALPVLHRAAPLRLQHLQQPPCLDELQVPPRSGERCHSTPLSTCVCVCMCVRSRYYSCCQDLKKKASGLKANHEIKDMF